jgi:hypothetical protein
MVESALFSAFSVLKFISTLTFVLHKHHACDFNENFPCRLLNYHIVFNQPTSFLLIISRNSLQTLLNSTLKNAQNKNENHILFKFFLVFLFTVWNFHFILMVHSMLWVEFFSMKRILNELASFHTLYLKISCCCFGHFIHITVRILLQSLNWTSEKFEISFLIDFLHSVKSWMYAKPDDAENSTSNNTNCCSCWETRAKPFTHVLKLSSTKKKGILTQHLLLILKKWKFFIFFFNSRHFFEAYETFTLEKENKFSTILREEWNLFSHSIFGVFDCAKNRNFLFLST